MIRRAALALALLLPLWLARPVAAVEAWQTTVRLTYYLDDAQPMADGEWPYMGAAACSFDLDLGTRITFADGFTVVCADRGRLGYGSPTWVDVFDGYWMPSEFGDYAEVEIQ